MKHIGMARLGRDAEVRYTPDGTAVANLSLAVTVFDKSAENNRGTQWVDASLWGKQAESLAQYMVKGSLHCFTLSDLRIEEYEGKNGWGAKLVARVDSVELGPRQGDAAAPSSGPRQGARTAAPAPKPKPQTEIPDDDIPF
jgi:single-strand DNA-binding protein